MRKKMLAAFLALVMVFTLLPTWAFATDYVAQIGDDSDKQYESLAAAVAAATDGDTVTLLKNAEGAGIIIDTSRFATTGLTIDLGNFTYTATELPAGSTSTKNQVFQLLKGGKVTIQNGTVEVAESAKHLFRFVIQNYCNLTLDNVTLDGTNLCINKEQGGQGTSDTSTYVVSNVCGNSTFTDTTIIPSTAANKANYAFDVDYQATNYSAGAQVTVQGNSVIKGAIDTSCLQASSTLTVKGGAFTDLATAVKYAENNATIKLADDASGAGIFLGEGSKTLTIDLNGKTYTCTGPAVGSTGTVNQVFHLEKGNTVTIKNGTVAVSGDYAQSVKFLIQNYCNLTLDGVTLDASNLTNFTGDSTSGTDSYAVSFNNGVSSITNSTIKGATGSHAFDVYQYTNGSYPEGAQVTVTDSTVIGDIETEYTKSPSTLSFTGTCTVTDLAAAVEYATDGATIKLADNVTLSDKLVLDKEITLDLNSKTITGIDEADYVIEKTGANVTIKNGTIEDVKTNSTGTVTAIRNNGGKLTLDKVSITQTGTSTNLIAVKNEDTTGSVLEIKGSGRITTTGQAVQNWGAATLSGGTYDGKVQTWAYVSGGTSVAGNTTISGGTYNGLVASIQMLDKGAWPTEPATTTISGGTFNAGVAELYKDATNGYQPTQDAEAHEGVNSEVVINKGTFSSEVDSTYLSSDVVAKIKHSNNSVQYQQTLSISSNVKDGSTVTLLKDCSTGRQTIGAALGPKNANITIDLGGHNWTVNGADNCGAVMFHSGATGNTVTFKNGTIFTESGLVAIAVKNNTVVLENSLAINTKVGAVLLEGSSTLNTAAIINNTGNCAAIQTNGSTSQNSTINVTGGNISSKDVAIYAPAGTLNISGGTITGTTGVYFKSRALNITGGTINGNGAEAPYTYNGNGCNATGDALVIDNCGYPGGEPVVSITDGVFNSTCAAAVGSYKNGDYTAITGFITGGTFNTALDEALIKSGYVANESAGTWTVTEKSDEPQVTYVAQIGEQGYESLAAAVKAATSGETVKLLDNASGAGLFIEKAQNNLTLDLNGFTYIVTSPAVGSAGTETQALHIEAANFTLKSSGSQGTLTSNGGEVKMLVQNYSNLTVENVILNGTNLPGTGRYVLSNNSGTTVIKDSKIIAKDGDFAFDSCKFQSYEIPTVTVTGSTINGNVEATGGKIVLGNGTSITGRILDLNGSDVTVGTGASVTFNGNNATIFVRDEGSKLTVSGTVTNTYDDNKGEGQTAISTNGSDVTAKTITIKAGASITSEHDVAIYLPSGTLNVEGGEITGATAVYFKSKAMTISGGTLTGNKTGTDYAFYNNGCHATGDALVIDNCNYPAGEGTVSVTGGTFIGTKAAVGSYVGNNQTTPLTGFITGGTFSSDVTDYLAEGYVATETTGGWKVSKEIKESVVAVQQSEIEAGTGENALDENKVTAINGELNAASNSDTITKVETGLANIATAAASTTTFATAAKAELTKGLSGDAEAEVASKVDSGDFTTYVSIQPKAAAKVPVGSGEEATSAIKLTFDVKPMIKVELGNETPAVEAVLTPDMVGGTGAKTFTSKVTFRLPLTSDFEVGSYVMVTHHVDENTENNEISYTTVQEDANHNRFIELAFNHFSDVDVEPTDDPVIFRYNNEDKNLSDFATVAAQIAGNDTAYIELLDDLIYYGADDEFGMQQPLKLDKDKNVRIQRNGHVLQVNTTGEGKFVFIDEPTGISATAVVENEATAKDLNTDFNVDIVLANTDDSMTEFAGAYVVVEITDYVTVNSAPDGWTHEDNTKVYVYENWTGGTYGSIGQFKLKAAKATPAVGAPVVTITKAQVVPDLNGAFTSGDVVAEIEGTAGSAIIIGDLEWNGEIPSTIDDVTYDGTQWNKYTAVAKPITGVTITVTPEYFSGNTLLGANAPKNAGEYTVQFTATAEGYQDLTSEKISFKIVPATFEVSFIETADFVYDGYEKTLYVDNAATVTSTLLGEATPSYDYKVEKVESGALKEANRIEKAAGTYKVTCTVTAGTNYEKVVVTDEVVIKTPEAKIVTKDDYISGYKMVYIFVEADGDDDGRTARVKYNGKKVYEITDLGYMVTGAGTDESPYALTARSDNKTADYRVFAYLMPGTEAVTGLEFVAFNSGLAGTIYRSTIADDKNTSNIYEPNADVNASKRIDLADAVAVATANAADSSITGKLTTYMATILRADVDGNGKVDVDDAAPIKTIYAPIPTT